MTSCVHIERMCDKFNCPCRCTQCCKEMVVIAQRLIDDDDMAYVWVS